MTLCSVPLGTARATYQPPRAARAMRRPPLVTRVCLHVKADARIASRGHTERERLFSTLHVAPSGHFYLHRLDRLPTSTHVTDPLCFEQAHQRRRSPHGSARRPGALARTRRPSRSEPPATPPRPAIVCSKDFRWSRCDFDFDRAWNHTWRVTPLASRCRRGSRMRDAAAHRPRQPRP